MSPLEKPGFLYVDDDARDAAALSFLLGEMCRFRHASGIEDARALVATETINIILCNQQLADGTGIEFLAELQGEGHSAFRIILSGMGGRDLILKALDQGIANFCLQKPVNGRELSMMVSQVMERDSLRRQNRELMHALQQCSQELEESLQLFRVFSDALPQAILLCDRLGRIVNANHQAEIRFGLGHQALVGHPADALLGIEWQSSMAEQGLDQPGEIKRLVLPSGDLILLLLPPALTV